MPDYNQLVQDHLNPGPKEDENPYEEFVTAQEQRKQSVVGTNLHQAQKTNPDQAAKAYDIGQQNKLPLDTVERNYDAIVARQTAEDNRNTINASPTLQRWYSSIENAKITHDDIGFLDKTAKWLKELGKPPEGVTKPSDIFEPYISLHKSAATPTEALDMIRSVPAGSVQTIGSQAGGLDALNQAFGNWVTDLLDVVGLEGIAETLSQPIPEDIAAISPSWWLRQIEHHGDTLAEAMRPAEERRGLHTDIAEGVGQIGTQALMFKTLGATPATASFGLLGADIASERAEAAGATEAQTGAAAVWGAIATGLSERIGIDQLLNRVPPALKNHFMRMVTDLTVAGGIEYAQEYLEAILHNMIEKGLYNPEAEIWTKPGREELAAGGAAAVVRAIIHTISGGRTLMTRQELAQQRVDEFKQYQEEITNSKVFQRHKGKFQEFVDSALVDEADPNVYIDAQNATTYFQNAGEDGAAVFEQLGVEDQVQEALAVGGDLKVPLSKFLSIADTDAYNGLLPDLRMHQGQETLREAQQAAEEQEQAVMAEAERIMAESDKRAEIEAGAAEVRNYVSEQLVATGRYDQVTSDRMAAIHEAFAVTLADKLPGELSPMQAYQQAYNLRIQAAPTPEAVAPAPAENVIADQPGFIEWEGDIRYSNDRVDSVVQEYAYANGNVLGVMAYIDPADFVYLTIKDTEDLALHGEVRPLDMEDMRANPSQPFLSIYPDGSVRNHEGRHRMYALAKAGYTKVPVVLVLYDEMGYRAPGEYNLPDGFELSGEDFGSQSRFDRGQYNLRDRKATISNPVNVTFENRAKLKDEFGETEGLTYFQQQDQAERNHMNLWSAVEQAVIDMPIQGWKANRKKLAAKIYTPAMAAEREEIRAALDVRFNELQKTGKSGDITDPAKIFETPEGKRLDELDRKRRDSELVMPTASGKEIWNKLKSMPGIKKEELTWLGIEDYLLGKDTSRPQGKFTRQEVLTFVRDNGVTIDEMIAEEEAQEEYQEINWDDGEVWDDEEAWEHNVEDMMYEFDQSDGEIDAGLGPTWPLEPWVENNLQVVVDNYEPALDEETAEEMDRIATEDGAASLIQFVEDMGYDLWADMKQEMRDDYEQAARDWAYELYMQDPQYIYEATNLDRNLYIFGNDDFGYSIRVDDWRDWNNIVGDELWSLGEAQIQAEEWARENDSLVGEERAEEGTHWGDDAYLMDGDWDNYREIKFRLPDISGDFYNTVHFPDRNIVAWARVDDRSLWYRKPLEGKAEVQQGDLFTWDIVDSATGVSLSTHGKYSKYTDAVADLEAGDYANYLEEQLNTFFLDEFQSDWHQQGRRDGYSTGIDAGELEQEARELLIDFEENVLGAIYKKLGDMYDIEPLYEWFEPADETRRRILSYQFDTKQTGAPTQLGPVYFNNIAYELIRNDFKIPENIYADEKPSGQLKFDTYEFVLQALTDSDLIDFKYAKQDVTEYDRMMAQAEAEREGVPDAPFKGDAWMSLGLKRALTLAVEEGYEAIAWPNAEVLSNRWSTRYRTLYETQYDKKMPSIMKKLSKLTPIQLETSYGEEMPTTAEAIRAQYEIKHDQAEGEDIDVDLWGVYRNGELIDNFMSEAMAEGWIEREVRLKAKPEGEGYYIIPLSPELKQRVKDDGFALFQKKEGGPTRGQISFPPGMGNEAVMSIFDAADLSTFLHESGHFFLQTYMQLAEQSPEINQDMDTLLKWFDVSDMSQVSVEQHEQFARGFEAYLYEGKAPSVALQNIFDRFKAWLMQIYKSIGKLNVRMTDEVRGVMDRMLANQQEIERANMNNQLLPMFEDAAAAGMTEAEYEAYRTSYMRAMQAAQRDIDAEILGRVKRQQKENYKEERDILAREILEELQAMPAHQARHYLMRGELPDGEPLPGFDKVKLSKAILVEMYGNEPDALWRELPFGKYSVWTTSEEGIHPDELAPVFGFTNGDEMVKAMAAAKGNLNKLATEEANMRMKKKYGDPDDPQQITDAALESVQDEERSNFLSVELRALEKKANLDRTPRQVINRAAVRIINQQRIGELREGAYLRAANKYANQAIRFAGEGKFAEASDAKRKQLLNQTLYREAIKAKKDIEKKVRYFAKFVKPGTRKNLARDYLDQIDSILEAYDFKKTVSMKEIEKRKSLTDWLDDQTAQGLEVVVPRNILERAARRNYKDMSYEEFIGLHDSIKNIEHIARFKQKLLVGKEKRDFQETIDSLIVTALENNTWKEPDKKGLRTNIDAARSFGRDFLASHVKMEFLLQQLDGNVPNGPWWTAVFRPIAEAEDTEIVMSQDAMTKLNDIFDRHFGKEGRQALYKRNLPTSNALGRDMKKAELMAIALNWGNEGNRKALLDGEGWDATVVQKALNDHMTESDWNAVQEIWDLIDSFWPQITALQNRLTGVSPPKVDAIPVDTPYGKLRGGYYPLVYDKERNTKAFKYEESMSIDEMFGGNHIKPATRQGHTQARVGSGGMAVELDLDVIGTHIGNVIHDLTHREPVLQADRILQNKQVADAIQSITSREMYRHIRPWLAGIASDNRPLASWFEKAVGRLRRGATAVNMGWKFTTAIVQPLGYLQSVDVLGEKWALVGLKRFYGNPIKAKHVINEVFTKSVMMRNRSKTFDRDIRDAIRRVKGQTWSDQVQRTLFSHIGFMDYSVSIPTWVGGYEKAMSEGMDEKAAIAYADSVVRMSQSAGGAKDLAAIQRGTEFQRSFTMFYSYFSVLHNLIRKRVQVSKKSGFTAANISRTTMSFLYLIMLPAVLAELITGRFPDEEEDEEFGLWAMKLTAAYPFMTMVGVRDFTNAWLTGYTYKSTPVIDAAESIYRTGGGIVDLTTDIMGVTEGEFDERDVKNFVMTAGYIYQLPARQLYITTEHLWQVLNGEEELSAYELLYRSKPE